MNLTQSGTSSIWLVDGCPEPLAALQTIVQAHYPVQTALTAAATLELWAQGHRADLIVINPRLPDMDAYALLSALKAQHGSAYPPVLFISDPCAEQEVARGLALGVADYVIQPIVPSLLWARLANLLALKKHQDACQAHGAQRQRAMEMVQDVSILALANLAELRDPETGHHLRRSQAYVQLLAQRLVHMGAYTAILTPRYVELLFMAAPLHDIGKVGVPDYILLHPGRLNSMEAERMEQHCRIGADAIEQAVHSAFQRAGAEQGGVLADHEYAPLEFLTVAKEIALYHHERWDGSGYPEGLAGESIPLAGRLMAVADVFDSLVSWRIYKRPVSLEEAVCIIQEASGTHFDPVIVEAFLQVSSQFKEIAMGHAANEYENQQGQLWPRQIMA